MTKSLLFLNMQMLYTALAQLFPKISLNRDNKA